MRTLAEIKGLCPCVKCGGKNAFLMANARNYFQVRCLECGNRTEWLNKVDAVITWFNMYIEAIDKDIVGERHYNLVQKCLKMLVRYEELEEITGIKDITFCHTNLFLVSCKTKSSAIEVVNKLLNEE